MFENVDGRLTDDGRTDDGRTTDAGVTGILIAHLGAFGSGELKIVTGWKRIKFLPCAMAFSTLPAPSSS